MADVLILFTAAMLTLAGGIVLALTVRSGQRRRALEARRRPAMLRAELDRTNQRIRRIDQAATDAELDRLDPTKEQ